MSNDKVTIYLQNDFGMFIKREGRIVKHGRRKYAQYDNAVEVQYKPKGAQKVRGFVQTYKPTTVIVEGWNQPDINEKNYTKVVCGAGMKIEETDTMFSDARSNRYDDWLNAMIEQGVVKVVADYREGQ